MDTMFAICEHTRMFTVTYSKRALKAMRRLPANKARLIKAKLCELAVDPEQMRNVKKLTNHPGYRLRVGDWRVIYVVEHEELRVVVIDVASRGEAYR